MAVIIGIVSPNGLFYGGVGTTVAEATGSACEALGEDFDAFATLEVEAIHDLLDAAVGELESADPRPSALGSAGPGVGGTSTPTATLANDPVPQPDDAGEPDQGAGRDGVEGDADPASGVAEAPAEAPQASPQCSVCRADITPDRAEVSTEDFGHPQCRSCSPD